MFGACLLTEAMVADGKTSANICRKYHVRAPCARHFYGNSVTVQMQLYLLISVPTDLDVITFTDATC